MHANPFESQLERLARTLTEQFGVQVICQGENAWTDGRQIVLPSVPEPMNEDLERMMVGYLDHEMGHVAFSEMKVAEEFARKHPGYDGLLNVVEDALIEKRAMERWPGVRANLDAMFRQVRSRVQDLISQRGPFERFCTAVYLKLAHYHDMLGLEQEVAGYEDLLDRFPTLRNTWDAAQLAADLLARWQQRQPRQKGQAPQSNQQPQSGTGDSSPDRPQSPGNSGNDQARANPKPGRPDSADPDSSGDDFRNSKSGSGNSKDANNHPERDRAARRRKKPTENPQQAESQEQQGGQPQHSGKAQTIGSLIEQALQEAIAEQMRQIDGSREYRVFSKQQDHIEVLPTANPAEARALLDADKDTVQRLRRGLTNALRSSEKRWWREDQGRGNLSPRRLYRLCSDRLELDVFRTRSIVQGKSTAVCIVLDASGSMTSRKMEVARRAMRVLLEALHDLKIPTEAFTFTTGNRLDVNQLVQQSGQDVYKLRERYGRISNLEIGIIKRFEEPVKAALHRLPDVRGTGLTPLGEAMQVGAMRLAPRPESRKIMLVLTDGKAGCEGGGDAAINHAVHIAGLIRKTGIELIGMGIQDDSLKVIVADTIVINCLEELPAQLCKLLGRTLQKGLKHVG